MRVLVVGAGATGGYFGGRLLQAGRDVTFLVRPRRAAQLAASGLVIRSPIGNVTLTNPATVTADKLDHEFDLILLTCKAYDLDAAVTAIQPAVGSETIILPLLNGMRHVDILADRFGSARVFGGLCAIAATLDDDFAIVHLNELHSLTFGPIVEDIDERMQPLTRTLCDAGFNAIASNNVVHDMWEKWVFLATLASATCLMRASIGEIVSSPGGKELVLGLLDECEVIASDAGYAPRETFLQRALAMLTDHDSTLTASMLRDIGAHSRIEADHIVGDLLCRRKSARDHNVGLSLLQIAYAHLKAYEAKRSAALTDKGTA